MVIIKFSDDVKKRFPGIHMAGTQVYEPGEGSPSIQIGTQRVKDVWNPETMKDHPTIRAYRDFFWKLGIDPTKIRPAGEALIRTAFSRGLPDINPVVNAMNIASAITAVPMSSFDQRVINDETLNVRFSKPGEVYEPHTGEPWILKGNEVVLVNSERILCLYPYRDSKFSLIKKDTKNLITVAYGVPGVQNIMQCISHMLELLRSVSKISTYT